MNRLECKRLLMVMVLSCIIAIAAVNVASAANSTTDISTKTTANNGGYTVIAAAGHGSLFRPMTVSSSITQGATNWHYKTISSYCTSLNVNLNWGNTANSLQLTITSPDGYTFGPYYDSSDGATDGRINLYITNSNGIAQGRWGYKVYGYSVTGTQTYTI